MSVRPSRAAVGLFLGVRPLQLQFWFGFGYAIDKQAVGADG